MKEEWEIVDKWPYEISSLGRVRRLPNTSKTGAKILSPGTTSQGYKCVQLLRGGKSTQRCMAVHRLVAEAFIKPLKFGEVVHHIDNNPANNTMNNLEITSSRGNQMRAVIDGRRHYKIGYKEVSMIKRLLYESNHTQQEIADMYGLAIITIHRIKTGKRWAGVRRDT